MSTSSDHLAFATGDPAFEAIARLGTQRYLSPQDVAAMPLPPNMDSTEAWAALAEIRRLARLEMPIPAGDGRIYWYAHTTEMLLLLRDVERLCSADSMLYHAAQKRDSRRFLVRSRTEEAIATARLDGLSIGYEQARDILLSDRRPRTVPEKVVANSWGVLKSLPAMAGEPFSVELLEELYSRVSHGIGERSRHLAPHAMTTSGELLPATSPERRADVLARVVEFAQERTAEPAEHPAITALLVQETILYWNVFPSLNGTLARLAFGLYALQNGYPVLGFLPIAKTLLDWRAGNVGVGDPPSDRIPAEHLTTRNEADMTYYVTLSLRLVAYALQAFRDYTEATRERDEELRTMLQTDPSLNHRQRSILGRALRRKGADFRIAYHKANHGIAYATARADLLGLVEKDYLVMEKEGRAFVFVAAPDLSDRIESRTRP